MALRRGYAFSSCNPPDSELSAIPIVHRSTAKGQCNPYRHEYPAAGLVEAPPDSPKPWVDAVSHIGDEHLGGYFEYREGSSHDDELDEETSGRVDELRKKSSEEQKRLGISQRRERSLLEQRPACPGFRRSASKSASRRRPPPARPSPSAAPARPPLVTLRSQPRNLPHRPDSALASRRRRR